MYPGQSESTEVTNFRRFSTVPAFLPLGSKNKKKTSKILALGSKKTGRFENLQGDDYNTGHFLDRVVLLRSNPRFCPIFRPSGVIGVIFALKKGPSGIIAVIYALKFRGFTPLYMVLLGVTPL